MILTREDIYQIDQVEQKRFVEEQAFEKGMKEGKAKGKAEGEAKGKAELIESLLRIRFPNDFIDVQSWRPKLYEKTSSVLDSLFPLSFSCASLNEFTQKL